MTAGLWPVDSSVNRQLMKKSKKISFVVPCYNEEGNIPDAYDAITREIEKFPKYGYEILFIDNASTDNSVRLLRRLAREDKHVKVILNRRNFGPERSPFYAILQTKGDAVIVVASDLQDPPEMIPDFIRAWEEGEDVVWGQKTNTKESRFMFFLRTVYYKLLKLFSAVTQYEHVTGFGLIDKTVVALLKNVNDPWPMLRNIVPDLGFVPKLLPYEQRARKKGVTSYTLFRYIDTAFSTFVHTSKVPLKTVIYTGAVCAALSFLTGCFYLLYKFMYWDSFSLGMAPILICFFFLASLQILFLGIMGEYILAIYDKVGFVRYVVEKERINFDD